MKILVINGPNLNLLGKREPGIYGVKTLDEINGLLKKRAGELGLEIVFSQSNSEGTLIDFIQANSPQASGIIINPGALTHYGLSLRDALADASIPVIEVHISNIYAREEWRAKSVIAPIARQISGLGWRGYLLAMETLAAEILKGASQ
ncbi:MAG: type II 3-dehydroquinate dehydratase [Chloroflexi bacterium]|nr:type II 3-dehydroquinate dehydratase [Chloroflexota bacterium]